MCVIRRDALIENRKPSGVVAAQFSRTVTFGIR
jgi:hypothetical protein